MKAPSYTALIADDEPPARARLVDLVTALSWLTCVGTASDGRQAIRMLDELTPDLIFLDIRMPGATGIDVLDQAEHQPYVVFTTAFDRYAVTAFELHAVDYLLKPFSERRFRIAAERARTVLETGSADRARSGIRARKAFEDTGRLQRLFVRSGGRIVPIKLAEVTRFEAQDDYVLIHTQERRHLAHLRLKDLANRLDPAAFKRIHRSHIVNVDKIRSLEPYDGHRLLVKLDDGTELVASKTGSRLLKGLVF